MPGTRAGLRFKETTRGNNMDGLDCVKKTLQVAELGTGPALTRPLFEERRPITQTRKRH
jgi:hypothetical protein